MARFDNIEKDEREAKLPVWAQNQLITMRRRVRNAEVTAAAARLATAPDESDAVLDPYGENIGLGKDPKVQFRLNGLDHEWIGVKLVHVRGRDLLEIQACRSVLVNHNSGNCFTIDLQR